MGADREESGVMEKSPWDRHHAAGRRVSPIACHAGNQVWLRWPERSALCRLRVLDASRQERGGRPEPMPAMTEK
jgi:hypothetical protein